MSIDMAREVFSNFEYRNRRAKKTLEYISKETGILIEQSLKRVLINEGYSFNDENDNKSHYIPQTMFDKLIKYHHADKPAFESTYWDMAYGLTIKEFVGKNAKSIFPNFGKEFIFSAVKDVKSSGAPLFKTKGLVKEQDFKRMWKIINDDVTPPPCTGYHRIQHGEQPKPRLVFGYPQSMTMLESGFARPLIEHFKNTNTAMAIGKHRFKLHAHMTQINNQPHKYSIDYSGFDSSICPQLICMAFRVLKKLFIDFNKTEELAWDKIVNYFINTPILMPDGRVYIKHWGVPSGSYFTQMIDSICNFFILQYCLLKLGYPSNIGRVKIVGDDSYFGMRVKISLKKLQDEMSIIGIKMNSDKTNKSEDDENDIEFLGHVWDKGIVDRDESEIVKRMVYPEKHSKMKDPRDRIVSRVYPYIADAKSAHNVIRKYSYGGGVPDKTYLAAGELRFEDGTDWMQFMSTTNDYEEYTHYYDLCYEGILH